MNKMTHTIVLPLKTNNDEGVYSQRKTIFCFEEQFQQDDDHICISPLTQQ